MKIEKQKLEKLLIFKKKTKKRASEGVEGKEFKFFNSSPIQDKTISNYDFNGEFLIFGTGGSASIHYYNGRFSSSADCLVASSNNLVIGKYIYYYLKSHMNLIEKTFHGSGLKHTSKERLSQIEVIYPTSKEEQKNIVSVIDRTEKLRMLRQEANKSYDYIIKALFFDMFGNPSMNSKGFIEKRLGEICNISMGGTPSTKREEYWKGGTVNWMKSGDIKGDFIDLIPQKITELGLKSSNAKMYNKGDVVIALNGQGKTRGTTGILNLNTTSNQSVASFSPNSELNNIYLHFNLKYRYQELRDLTGDKQRSGLNLTLLRNLKITLPPIESQNKFSLIVEKLRLFKNNQVNSTLEINSVYNSLIERVIPR